jgi:hypothetical protein
MTSNNKFFDAVQTTKAQASIPNIKSELSHLQSNPQDKWSTDLYITTPIELAQKIVAYFNSILPSSAKIAQAQQTLANKNGLFTKITIDNTVLIKPTFLDAINVALNEYSLDELDQYRVQSGTLSRKTSETLIKLHQLAVSFTKSLNNNSNSVAEELIASITRLKTYFDNQSVVKSVPNNLIKDIHSKRRILKGLLTPEDDLLENFLNNLDKPLKQAIQTVMKAINDQFGPIVNTLTAPQQSNGNDILSYGPGMRC